MKTIPTITDVGPIVRHDEKVLILGGGASGIAIGKTFSQRGIPFDIIEREDDFGGNWYLNSPASKVYRSAHLISSKTNTQLSDYPMPDDYPHYPSHTQFLAYLRDVAKTFGLYEKTRFNVEIKALSPFEGGWLAELSDNSRHWYADVVVANGLLRDPIFPAIPGHFSGELIHSIDYVSSDVFDGKRVLVVGGGNSGCDIAVDSAQRASYTCHSMRRGYHYMPKFIDGKPTQEWLMEIVSQFESPEAYWEHVQATFKLAGFDGTDFGLPKPDHAIHQAHPILNSNILYCMGHGDLVSKPDVVSFDDEWVEFADGSRDKFDVVLLATGYKPSLPFLDSSVLDREKGMNQLFLHSVPMHYDSIVFAGYFNIPSGFGNLANNCSRFLANYFLSKRRNTASWRVFNQFKHYQDEIDIGHGQFVNTRRHANELDLWKYIKTVNFISEQLEAELDHSSV
ncbi:monooxygenase [Veronia nyctiphanis]|uniref:Monooxygenase n=1 Tax=Veronia nyctiphanis TaxID=1278244 RepID=A0A4Q0YLP3_9GAMM|nr:NAD(P)-binding domain-containing protein [Veronia nyctiphanis]RXJ71690.1 monooxygenase [Veronia nyctiphanis]